MYILKLKIELNNKVIVRVIFKIVNIIYRYLIVNLKIYIIFKN